MITKHVSLWYNVIYNMIKLLDNYLFYFAKICLKYTSSNMFWIVLLNKNLRTFWGWFVIKHPINKNSISLTSEIMCSYMRVCTVVLYNKTLRRRRRRKVEIKDTSSLQLKEIHIHVIFTFWKKSLVS